VDIFAAYARARTARRLFGAGAAPFAHPRHLRRCGCRAALGPSL